MFFFAPYAGGGSASGVNAAGFGSATVREVRGSSRRFISAASAAVIAATRAACGPGYKEIDAVQLVGATP